MPKSAEKKVEQILILCVDRDDDLGIKARVKTPILGRDENLSAAISLALQDPEEPDANAMFEAVRIYDRSMEKAEANEEHQIATISGSELVGVEADGKLISELTSVLEAFPASGVILVTDGFADEAVLPLIESRVPVNSVRRIVIKHSESIEETAAVFFRYLKTLVENPRYSRYFLGLPGILIILLATLYFVPNGLLYAGLAFLFIIGALLFVKGFRIDERIMDLSRRVRSYSPPPLQKEVVGFSATVGMLSIAIGCYQGGANAAYQISGIQPPLANIAEWLARLPSIIGWFISGSVTLIVIGVCVILSGGAIRWFLERDTRLWRSLVVIVVAVWSRQIFFEVSQILVYPELNYTGRLVTAIIVGIFLAMVSALAAFLLNKKYAEFFVEKEETVEEPKQG
jgi:putative membrane protein